MIHAVLYVAFILPFTAWLGFELKRNYSLSEQKKWIVAAVFGGLIGGLLSLLNPYVFGNFLLHMSGGVSATFLFVYLFKTLKLQFSWRLELVLLFAFVCMLGVLNELAEYFLELLGFGPLSHDTQDTWRDFVANTVGALLTWGIIQAWWYTTRQQKN